MMTMKVLENPKQSYGNQAEDKTRDFTNSN